MSASIETLHLTAVVMSNLWKVFPQQATQSGMMTMLRLLKSGKLILRCERSGRPDVDSRREARPQQFIIGNDETELELSVESRSFVNRVNDQVRKRQKRIANVTENAENIL